MKSDYYSIKNYLLYFYEKNSKKYTFKGTTLDECEIWKESVKEKLSELIGLNSFEQSELSFEILETIQENGYKRKKVLLKTMETVFMPLYILIPEKSNNIPIIALHGHASDGKNGLVGLTTPYTEEKIKQFRYTYALDLVKKGYIVFCPDLCGSGDRREEKNQGSEKALMSSCNDINNALMSLGMSLIGVYVYELKKLIDYIEKCDFCDSKRLMCCGFSGGALASLWIGALDDRIKRVIVSGYYHGFRDTILKTNLCGCNFVPNLWLYIDVCDLGKMIAPRPLFVESGIFDNLNGSRGITDVYEQIEATRNVYKLYGCEERLEHKVFEDEHKWYGLAYDFIDKWGVINE